MAEITPPAGLDAEVGGPFDPHELYRLSAAASVDAAGRVEWSADVLEAFAAQPAIDPIRDRVAVRDQGVLVGATLVEHASPYVSATIHGFVDPEHRGRGIGSSMLDWGLRRVEERIEHAPPGARVTAAADAHDGYRPAAALLEDFGFSAQRFYLEMAVEWERRPDPPQTPAGIELRPFDSEHDLPVLSRVVADAFRDHFGHVARTEEEDLARWRVFASMEAWRDDLVWIAYDGTEPVGAVVAIDHHGSDHATGYIATLGVRRPWRGRGLARAMLLIAFAAIYDDGRSGAALHVDADSLTGATRLYEGVGMTTVSRMVSYLRELRPGEEHVVRTGEDVVG